LRRIGIVEKGVSNACQTSVEERHRASILFQHGAHFLDERSVMGACCLQEGVLFGSRQVGGLVEEALNAVPPAVIHI
jgi:hypothetical protein